MIKQKRLAIFRKKFADVCTARGGVMHQILGMYTVNQVLTDERKIADLLAKNAPMDIYVLEEISKKKKKKSAKTIDLPPTAQNDEEIKTQEEKTEAGEENEPNGSTES